MTAQIGELDREGLICRAAEALATRLSKQRKPPARVSLKNSDADRNGIRLRTAEGDEVAVYSIVRERGTLQLRWRDPARSR